MKNSIDLRSDTVTKPTPEMLDVMMGAEVGDDIYGEDPSVTALEEYVAKLLGKEAAMFVPSGTMANQIAISLHTNHGDSIIAEDESHCFLYEAGGAAALSGVQFQFIPWSEGFSDEAIELAYKPEWMHYATSKLLIVENTHNRAAGRVFDKTEMDRITAKAHMLGLKAHCDGARIWNAAVATKTSEKDLAAGLDSIACCFSKGLGAPVGSALAGDADFIERGRKVRKRFGGAMRQSGFLAKAALFALENYRDRLAEDHNNLSMLAEALNGLQKTGLEVEVMFPKPSTNLLYFRLGNTKGDEQAKWLEDNGVRMHHLGDGWIRAVSHMQVSTSQMEQAVETVGSMLKKFSK
jgi:threonine aldolase